MNAQLILRLLSIMVPLLVVMPAGAAEIVARTSQETVRVGQPFSLFLEARGEVESPPDLSVLHEAFEILGRSQRRNVQVINGRSIHRASLTLTLSPRTAGKLTIPAISFGTDKSQPIALEVTSGYQGTQQQWQAPRAPRPSGSYLAAPQTPGEKAPTQAQSPSSPIAVNRHSTGASNIWPWVSLVLALGWALTVGAWGASLKRRRQKAVVPVAKESRLEPTLPTPPTALDIARKQVEDACSSRDAERTKNALLDWARHLWPEDPPNNLSGIARRCPPDVEKGILEFERSLYSPEAEPWYDQPMWKRLAEVTAESGKSAA